MILAKKIEYIYYDDFNPDKVKDLGPYMGWDPKLSWN